MCVLPMLRKSFNVYIYQIQDSFAQIVICCKALTYVTDNRLYSSKAHLDQKYCCGVIYLLDIKRCLEMIFCYFHGV